VRDFVARLGDRVTGFLSGFDRRVLRGSCRQLCYVEGLRSVLAHEKVLLKDFGDWARGLTERLKAAVYSAVEAAGRPVEYLSSAALSKEKIARQHLEDDPVEHGPVCLLTSVEPCLSFDIHRSRERKRLELVARHRKCLHLYLYLLHERFGFCHVRIQTWLPFTVQVCLNGREWLARQMDAKGLGYQRADNVFLHLEDLGKAQRLFDRQLKTRWPSVLDGLARLLNPLHGRLLPRCRQAYYWTTHQVEWATDVFFRKASDLAGLYPLYVRHAMCHLKSRDVLRFLGKKLPAHFVGEVTSDYRHRVEGVRVKHRAGRNSVKVYDKAPHVLRVETTVHDCRDLRAYRPKEGDEDGPREWRPVRKGVADLHRVTAISQAANERYLDALAAVDPDDKTPLHEVMKHVARRTTWKGRPARGLRPFQDDDARLLEAVAQGGFLVKGFRNRDLLARLHGAAHSSVARRKRLAARVTRKIRLLRAHGLVRKVQATHRYLLTAKGRRICTAVLAARNAPYNRLAQGLAS